MYVFDFCARLEEDAKEFYRTRNRISCDASLSPEITEDMICTMDDRRNVESGLPLQQYDALLIYADLDEEDAEFAQMLIKELTVLRDLKVISALNVFPIIFS